VDIEQHGPSEHAIYAPVALSAVARPPPVAIDWAVSPTVPTTSAVTARPSRRSKPALDLLGVDTGYLAEFFDLGVPVGEVGQGKERVAILWQVADFNLSVEFALLFLLDFVYPVPIGFAWIDANAV
jgi:hypothetical protein